MVKKKWVAVALVAVIAVATFGYWAKDALVDTDGDGIMNFQDAYPTQHNFPATVYAEDKLLSSGIIEKISCLDSDCELDDYETAFIDYISDFDGDLQNSIAQCFLADGNVSSEERRQILFLKTFSREEQVSMVRNGTFSNFDWDGDNMNNYFEKEIAHLPYDVYNGRYAIIVDTADVAEEGSITYDFLVKQQRFFPQNVIKLISVNATIEKFRQYCLELAEKVNINDILFCALKGHGVKDYIVFNDGNGNNQLITELMSYAEINEYLKMDPKMSLITIFACQSESAAVTLKQDSFPGVFADIGAHWFYLTSEEYNNVHHTGVNQPETKVFDIDGNGYVSIGESIEIAIEYETESSTGVTVVDLENIVSSFYLGDFEILGQDSSALLK